MRVSDWLTDWLDLRRSEIRPRTIESYSDLFTRYIFPAIGDIDVADLDPGPIRHLLADIIRSGHSRTAELVYVLLKAALAELDHNPMPKIRRPKHTQQSPDPWTDAEARIYLAALDGHPHGLALSLAIILGMRRGEVCGLRWGDIDLEIGILTVRNQRIRLATGEIVDAPPKSATSIRAIPLPEALLVRLRAARGLPAAYVCRLTPSGLDSAHRRLVRDLGLPPIPLHGLRHTMATACIRHGGDMRALQSVLGHASYAVTADRYTHPDLDMMQSAVDVGTALCYTV